MKKYSCTFLVTLLFSINVQAQEIKFKMFETTDFTLLYPENWKTEKDGNVFNFYLDTRLGDISISVYKDGNLSDDIIKDAMLSINEQHTSSDKVDINIKAGIKEYTYTYTKEEIKWIAKGIKKGADFYFITLNWKVKDWDRYSQLFIKAFDSFSAK